jgi:phosphoribosyl-ATP pyrophosphohydrolase
MSKLFEVLERLAATIETRKGGDPAASYTAKLLNDPALAAKKLGEEAVETVIAAVAQGTPTPWPPRAPTCCTTGWC